jgi:hypothetical protein
MSALSLRLPDSLHKRIAELAMRDNVRITGSSPSLWLKKPLRFGQKNICTSEAVGRVERSSMRY